MVGLCGSCVGEAAAAAVIPRGLSSGHAVYGASYGASVPCRRALQQPLCEGRGDRGAVDLGHDNMALGCEWIRVRL